MNQYKMIIDGQPVASSKFSDVINPATGAAFAQSAVATSDDVDRAVAAAAAAFKSWSATPEQQRKDKLREVAALLEQHMPELMELVTKESGKPMAGLNGIGSGMEVGGAIAWAQVSPEEDFPVEVVVDDDDTRIEVHRKPLGVVASITPWNWPLMIAIWHVIPALQTGNTVIIKPSPFTPIATSRFVELANSVLPAGVLNIVTGGPEIGAAISEHPGIAKIVFTGSTPTGKHIMRSAAGNLKRLTLELGGNDAGIVLDDVNPADIAPQLLTACFHNNGQTCAALKRLYVPDSIYEALCGELAALAKQLVVGDGMDEATQLGPLQNKRQLEIVQSLADDARANGGRFLCGGSAIAGDGYFFEPTIVADLSDGSRLVDEEPFGPIVPIIKYTDIEDVLARANNSDSGLGGSVWSADIERAKGLALRLEAGSVWVNEHGSLHPNAPFGGVKQSGYGVEFGSHGLKEFTAIQTLKIMK